MGITYDIENDLAVITATGSFTCKDVEKELCSLVEDENFKSGMRLLFIDKGSDYSPPKHEPESAANMLASFLPNVSHRMAIMVTRDIHFGIARMTQTYCEFHGIDFQVFKEEEKARTWLKNDPE